MSDLVQDPEEMEESELEALLSEQTTDESEGSTEESPDTETETPAEDTEAADTDTETAEDSTQEAVDPTLKAFREEGLDKTYATPEAALRALREAQAEIGRLRREQADLRGQHPSPEPAKPPEFNADEWLDKFQADPREALTSFMQEHGSKELAELRQQVQELTASNQLNQAIAEHPDIRERETEIVAEIQGDKVLSELYALNPGWVVKQARARVIAANPPQVTPPKVETPPVSAQTKASAKTTVAGVAPKRGAKSKTVDDWENMTEEEIEAAVGLND